MSEEHAIVRQIRAAQEDGEAADALIRQYMPFIKAETAKFMGRLPMEGRDDELGIAMLAFYEAMMAYRPGKGAFIKLAAAAIRNRLIDQYRKTQRYAGEVSLDAPVPGEESGSLLERTADEDEIGSRHTRAAARDEIAEFARQLGRFGLSLPDVADSCPRQARTLEACMRALEYAKTHPILLDEMLHTGKLPLIKLCEGARLERKTLERHRKYLIAILLAYTNGFEIIRGHLRQMKREEGERTCAIS